MHLMVVTPQTLRSVMSHTGPDPKDSGPYSFRQGMVGEPHKPILQMGRLRAELLISTSIRPGTGIPERSEPWGQPEAAVV